MGRPVSYERAVAWKVLNEEENAHCICLVFINWSFVWDLCVLLNNLFLISRGTFCLVVVARQVLLLFLMFVGKHINSILFENWRHTLLLINYVWWWWWWSFPFLWLLVHLAFQNFYSISFQKICSVMAIITLNNELVFRIKLRCKPEI